MATERLYQFPSKTTAVPADIIYMGDSAAAFDEVNMTVAGLLGAYPTVLGIGGVTLTTNEYVYVNNSGSYTAGAITTFGVNSLALAAVNNAVLSTGGGGVPVLSTVLPGGLTTTDPVTAQGLATKNYVDQNALTGTQVYAASATTLGTVTQSGAGVGATLTNAGSQATFALDGVNPPVGSNVLIKNTSTGATAANEGIYTVTSVGSGTTNWVLTRATSYDTPAEINRTGLITVQNGTANAGTAWYNTNTIATVDTTSFSYSRFGVTSPINKIVSQEFTSGTSTYEPSAGMVYCVVTITAGGNSGGASASAAGQGSAGGGGGGGGTGISLFTAANIGASATVVVGAATAGSSFTCAGTGTTITASAGTVGGAGVASASANIAGGGAGGTCTGGNIANLTGGQGGYGYSPVPTAISVGGYGGGSYFGEGAALQAQNTGNSGAGLNAANYGSGGGGAITVNGGGAQTGGTGFAGYCTVIEYCSV